ncbi:MAG: sulfotransferase [Deltaproteobacteria bacterium]|nr:sulfotransferase [Deltaproteobacteria bacterium]
MYFVLSTGRAGSRTIATALNQIPGTVCLHHPKPELVAEATAFFCGTEPRAEIEKVLRETRKSTLDGKVYGEVNLQHTLLFPILRDVFPEAKYIWLIRDGRDSVASMYYRGWYDEVYPRQGPEWRKGRLHGDRTGDYTHEQWAAMSRFEKCCWCWLKYNQVIEDQLSRLEPSMWAKVRLDRLTSSLPRLQKFLELPELGKVQVEQLNTARQPVSYWERWTPRQRASFEKICGAAMDRWFPEWKSPSGIWRNLAAEPVHHPGRVETLWRNSRATAERVSGQLKRVGARMRG